MKSILKRFLLLFIVLTANAEAYQYNQPLMVIRFNSPYVEYEKSLSMAVTAAVKAKKDVVFDITAGTGARMQGGRVAQDIIQLGVKPTNVRLRNSGFNNNEVLIFVR